MSQEPNYEDGSIPVDTPLFLKTTVFPQPVAARWDGREWFAPRVRGIMPRENVLLWSLNHDDLV